MIPFFGDQFRNAFRVETAGYGKFMSIHDLTKESFSNAINELVSNESYMRKAKETSAIFKDNLVHPMDEALFWIEHVCKFKGARHLKSHAVNMSWFTYLSLDILLVNVVIVLAVIYSLFWALRKVFTKKNAQINANKKHK